MMLLFPEFFFQNLAGHGRVCLSFGLFHHLAYKKRERVLLAGLVVGYRLLVPGEDGLYDRLYFAAILAQFQAHNPGVVTDLILSERELNLSQRDADVAIRVTNEPPETLVGRRICTIRWAVYGRRDQAGEAGAIDRVPFVGFADDFGPPFGRRWRKSFGSNRTTW